MLNYKSTIVLSDKCHSRDDVANLKVSENEPDEFHYHYASNMK
jgi:hypothetical protein